MDKKPSPYPGFIHTKKLSMTLEEAWVRSMKERKAFLSWNGKFTRPVTKHLKISLCTTCMDRLDTLKQTLPQNIADNIDYPNVEFILLDYNSRDGLGHWVKTNLMEYIERGVLNYFRTEEPEYFDMCHSRNVAFLAASGHVVNNIDADALAKKGFAELINRMANEIPRKAFFAKSRQLLRGRMGMFRDEFIDLLSGYNETDIHYYGHDDADLMNRAWELGFTMMPYARQGDFVGIVPHHVKHREGNYPTPWWESEGKNRLISYATIIVGQFKANLGRIWGKAKLIKNFREEVETGVQG
jgi:glycosyltransferase involved in cell wall biosynthesis